MASSCVEPAEETEEEARVRTIPILLPSTYSPLRIVWSAMLWATWSRTESSVRSGGGGG